MKNCAALLKMLGLYKRKYDHELRAAEDQLESESRNRNLSKDSRDGEQRLASNTASSVGKLANNIKKIVKINRDWRSTSECITARERLNLAKYITDLGSVEWDDSVCTVSVGQYLETKDYRKKCDFSGIVKEASIILPMIKKRESLKLTKINYGHHGSILERN